MPSKQLLDCFWGQEFFAAGVESTSTTVEWALAELIQHPDLMERAQKEIHAVVDSNRLVQQSDFASLPLLQAIVKETLRLHPPAPIGIPRESTSEAAAMGYKIPAHTTILLNNCWNSIYLKPCL